MYNLLHLGLAYERELEARRRSGPPQAGRRSPQRRAPIVLAALGLLAATLGTVGCGSAEVPAPPPPAIQPAKPPTAADIRQKVKSSVVRITGHRSLLGGQSGGTGWYVGDGKIVTAEHVIAGTADTSVNFKGQRVSARVQAADPFNDVAVLDIDSVPEGLVPVKLGDSDKVQDGETAYVFGFPASGLSRDGQSRQLRMTSGIVGATGLHSRVAPNLPEYPSLMQVDAAIVEGDSGGILTDAQGNVIGMPIAGNHETDENYAISINQIKTLLPALEAGKSPATMGLDLVVLTRSEVRSILRVDWDRPTAIVVLGVKSGGPGDKAGFELGDIITSAEGRRVGTLPAINEVMASHTRGDTLKIKGYSDAGPYYLSFEKRVKLK